jgi:O-antigen/teichoic acid export membrane protein
MQNNNKRIAKNTIYLYFRTLLTMIVSLFTSRVILNTLGVVDYGLNNVVAGVITLFSFLNGALGASTSRFLTFELGKNDTDQLKQVFRTAFNIHLILAIIVVIFCETAGLWIVNNVLVIPPERLFACNVIFQFVVVSALLSITQVPMNAQIIAHERMNVYAYLGVSDAILKLVVAYLIMVSTFDKLITLGALSLCISFGMYIFCHIYSKKHFAEYNFGLKTNKRLNKEMLGFSIWSLVGSSAVMLKKQGVNILINIFFGPSVNAANAIAYQVNHAITVFSNNFTMALNPQITKSYAANEKIQMKNLIFRGSRFSFFLLMIFTIPVLLEADTLLKLWFVNTPLYTAILTRLVITLTLVECFIYTLGIAIQATGKIKYYQIVVSGTILLNFPISYIFYKIGGAPYTALIVSIGLSIITVFIRLIFINAYLEISIVEYSKKVLFVSLLVLITSIAIPLNIHLYLNPGLFRLITVTFASLICSALFIYLLGLKKEEKNIVHSYIKRKIFKM